MEPLDYLRALRRRWVIVLAAALLGATGGWLTAPTEASSSPSIRASGGTYQATQNLIVDRQSSDRRSSKSADTTNLPLLAVLATSGEVPLRVVDRLGLKTPPAAVASKVKVEADQKLAALRISSTGSNPEEVAALVDAFGEEILRLAAERNEALRMEALNRAKATVEAQQVRLRHLDARLVQLPPAGSEARLLTAERDALIKVYAEQQAVLQELQSQPPASPGLVSLGPAVPVPAGSGEISSGAALQVVGSRRARTGVGTLLGFALGCALALLVDRLDTRIRGRRDAEQAFGLPVVAELPRTRPLSARATAPGGTFGVDPETADAYGRLALAVLHTPRWVLSPRPPSIVQDDEDDAGAPPVRLVEGPARLVLVSSPGREEARAAVIANLAASLAASGRSVIAIDCDPERPRLAELLGARAEPGPAGPAERAVEGTPAGQLGVKPTGVRGVWVVIAGASRGADVAADGQRMRSYLEWGDIVLVDAGPILSGGEAGAWAVEADAVLIVTAVSRTTAETAALTHEHLARLQAKVLGVALVDGVARTVRSRSRNAPSPVPAPPRTSSVGIPSGARSVPPPPSPTAAREPSRGAVTPSATAQHNGGATTHRLRGQPVAPGEGQQSAAAPQPPSPRTDPGERIAPVLEVLAPETPEAGANRPPRRRPRNERTPGNGPVWSVSRPWPWATADERVPNSTGASPTAATSEPANRSAEEPTEGRS